MAEENFNPHHPCGWWRGRFLTSSTSILDFNPHHPCGWWQFILTTKHWRSAISIHTTRVGGDENSCTVRNVYWYFNPHHPCGWWPIYEDLQEKYNLFQSTPPVWVVTFSTDNNIQFWKNFNPHHPCGWWHLIVSATSEAKHNFNPHHPCGWWQVEFLKNRGSDKFQSTPPVWVVTMYFLLESILFNISIHTTRVGGDDIGICSRVSKFQFQSTPPVWVVTLFKYGSLVCPEFQSTPPVWVVTAGASAKSLGALDFNPHHPCGWWLTNFVRRKFNKNFNPHHPCGWWPSYTSLIETSGHFNPHHPCGWWPVARGGFFGLYIISIHTTRVGGDQQKAWWYICLIYFNPHHPCGWWLINFFPFHKAF